MTTALPFPRCRGWLPVLVAAALLGCAIDDGGVGGTGISVIEGNVANGGAALISVSVAEDRGGIAVRVRGTPVETLTAADGFFRLEGEFSGFTTLEFVEPDATVNSMDLDVPAGGDVTLVNVRFDRVHRLAFSERIDVDFEAIAVEDAQCDGAAGLLRVTDRSGAANPFLLRITASTKLEEDDQPTAAPGCTDLTDGRILRVRGTLIESEVVADRIRLLRARPRADLSAPG